MTVSRLRGLPPSAWCLGLAAWFLLPAAFQTGLTFLSEVRGVWEGLYLLLSLWLVWRTRALWQAGPWRAAPALCAGAGALFAQNLFLAAALAALAWALRRPMACRPSRILSAAALAVVTLGVVLRLLAGAAGFGPPRFLPYQVAVPAGTAGEFASVTVTAPGAMGRVRYHAVEQRPLLSLGPLATVSAVTGLDSAPSGTGKYGFVIDWYFEDLDRYRP